MSKVKIVSRLENITQKETFKNDCIGIYRDAKLIYKENEIQCEFHFKKDVFMYKRKINDSEIFIFYFQERKESCIKYENKLLNQFIEIPLYTEKINWLEQKIDIFYQVDKNEKFHFTLEYRM